MTQEQTPPDLLPRALQAFQAGNYALAREIAEKLAKSDNPSVALQAQELLVRLSPVPLGAYLLLLTGILLLATTLFVYLP
jgi:hypothetical protein